MVELILIALLILQLLDIYTTNNIIKLGGVELNPILKKLFELVGVMPGLLLSKTIFIGVLTYFYLYIPDIFNTGITLFVILLLIYTIVVGNNFRVMQALKKRSIN